MKFFPEIDNPIFMPAHVANKIESLTYVEDVASAVQQVLRVGESAWNQAYNIAMEEEFSLANILLRMRDGLGVDEEQFLSKIEFSKMIFSVSYLFIKTGPGCRREPRV